MSWKLCTSNISLYAFICWLRQISFQQSWVFRLWENLRACTEVFIACDHIKNLVCTIGKKFCLKKKLFENYKICHQVKLKVNGAQVNKMQRIKTRLRILTGKKHPKIKLHKKYEYWHLGRWYIKLTLFKRFWNWNKFSKKNK